MSFERRNFSACGHDGDLCFHFRNGAEEQVADLFGDGCAGEIEARFRGEAIDFAAGAEDGARGAAIAEGADEGIGDEFLVFGGVEAAEGEVAEAGQAAAASCAGEMVAACIIFAATLSGLALAF